MQTTRTRTVPGDSEIGYKVLTHHGCPPLQGGKPVWDGKTLPFMLPTVPLDTTDAACGSSGWHYCRKLRDALAIGRLWPTGRPSHVLVVTPAPDVVHRGDKSRASALTIVRPVTPDELRAGIAALSAPFGSHRDFMVEEQLAWRAALARPGADAVGVEAMLRLALETRGLTWQLKRFPGTKEAWEPWEAWQAWQPWEAWETRQAWQAWQARQARQAWEAWQARQARQARQAWEAWQARQPWEAWEAWQAWQAWQALVFAFASKKKWISHRADLLTVGLRDAYRAGLGLALPTGPNELGWAMDGTA